MKPPRRKAWPIFAQILFVVGAVAAVRAAWESWGPDPDENPRVAIALVWVIGGLAHTFFRNYWEACAACTVGSMIAYVALAVAVTADPFHKEMFVSGLIVVGFLGFLGSMIMGIPVAMYRRYHF